MKYFHELPLLPSQSIVFLDIDGTFTGEGSWEVSGKDLHQIQKLRKKNEVYLCTNGKNEKRKKHFSQVTGIPLLKTKLRKPDKRIASLVPNKSKKSFVVIGNLALRDGKLAKNIGGKFIKVKTLLGPDDTLFARLLYWVDDTFITPFQ